MYVLNNSTKLCVHNRYDGNVQLSFFRFYVNKRINSLQFLFLNSLNASKCSSILMTPKFVAKNWSAAADVSRAGQCQIWDLQKLSCVNPTFVIYLKSVLSHNEDAVHCSIWIHSQTYYSAISVIICFTGCLVQVADRLKQCIVCSIVIKKYLGNK